MEENKKKESIDDILSDLNGLLNKMPSILDGIKMPELQPVEPPKPAPQPEPAPAPRTEAPPPSPDAEKTIVLQPFSGLTEGAPVPQEIPPAVPADESDKTVVLEPFAGISAGEPAPGDAMPEDKPEQQPEPQPELQPEPQPDPFQTEEADKTIVLEAFSGLAEGSPAPAPAPEPQPEAGFGPSVPAGASDGSGTPADLDVFATFEATPAEPAPAAPATPKAHKLTVDDSTRDFGIPDIDALIQMSEGPAAARGPEASLPQAGVIPEAVHAIEEQQTNLPTQGLFQETEASGGVPMEPGANKEEPAIEQTPVIPSPFDAFAIEPSAQEAAQAAPEPAAAQPSGEAGGLVLEPQAEPALNVDLPQPEAQPQAEPALSVNVPQPEAQQQDAGETVKFETPAQAGGLELSPAVNLSVTPAQEAADQTMPGSSALEQGAVPQQAAGPGGGGLELSVGTPSSGGEETLVVSPQPAASSGEEEKTMIFQAAPATTSRAQAGDLTGLAAKTVPPGIPDDRVRSLMFMYSPEDKALCATVLAELDSICLKSATKPMFVKRASVKEFEQDVNSGFIQQSVTDSGAQGLVCLGSIPQEKVYELENLYNTSGGFFRYYDSASFSHSAALDLVVDLILR